MMLISKISRKFIQPLHPLGRALKIVWQAAPGWTAASIVLLIATGLLPILSLYLLKLMLDGITSALIATDREAAFQHVAILIGAAGLVALVSSLVRIIYGVVAEAHSRLVVDRLFEKLHERAATIDLEFYENAE